LRRSVLVSLTAVALLAPAVGAPTVTSPQLIDAAQERGDLSRATAALYTGYALLAPGRVPERFRSDEPIRATMPLLQIHRAAQSLPSSGTRTRLRELLAEQRAPGDTQTGAFATQCDALSTEPKTQRYESEFFFVDFNPGELRTLTIQQYAAVLDATYRREVVEYGWADPPQQPRPRGFPAVQPLAKYHVKISAALGPAIFGYVSNNGTYAGAVGDNPKTTGWAEQDSQASCMGLNNDFGNFATSNDPAERRQQALAALEATVAHEFVHSIQFAYGGLTGPDDPDLNFSEGMATWMEDEVFDAANDNLRYLYPEFEDSMGEHEGDEYGYWFVWRGLVERFGANQVGGSEDVWQRFWEAGSRGTASHLDAVRAALAPEGISLEDAYHDFAVAARFVKPCVGGVVELPFCFEEAALYAGDSRGTPASLAAIDQVGGDYGVEDAATIEDHFALNWIDLPRNAQPYDVSLQTASSRPAGRVRLSVACDLGAALRRSESRTALGEATVTVRFDPSGCQTRPVAVLTNETQLASDPREDSARAYVLRTALAPADQTGGGGGSGGGGTTGTTTTTTGATTPAPATTTPSTTGTAGSGATVCTFRPAFRSVDVGRRGSGVRIALSRSVEQRVDVDVFQHAQGRRVLGERLVARFRARSSSFTWNGRANRPGRRVTDGVYSVRFRVRSGAGVEDVRRETLRRANGRFSEGRAFDRVQSCGAVRAFKLLRPVFGGRTNRANEVTFVLGGEARVRLELRRGSRVVLRRDAGTRSPGVVHRLRVDAERLARGTYEVRLVVQGAAGRPVTERLFAQRL
jgi:hypothetical protein